MEESEEALVTRCQAGETEAFGTLVRRYTGRAVGTASLLLGGYDDALDASQDAFVRAWRSIHSFKRKASFYTWYSTILRNVCFTRIRQREKGQGEKTIEENLAPADQSDPYLLVERNEQSERIQRAILQLPVHQRDIIVMSHFQQMRYKQIAEQLDIPIGTVMSRLHNARKSLRKALEGDSP